MPEISEYGQDNPLLPLIDAYKGTRDWKDAFSQALRRVGQNVGVVPTPEKRQLRDEAQSVMPEMSSPAQRQIVQDLAMGFGTDAGAGGGLVGALRKGGRPDLYATHATHVMDNYVPPASPDHPLYVPKERTILPTQLTGPSFAVQSYKRGDPDANIPWYRDDVAGPGRSMVIVPREGAVDPASYPGVIYNRDAMTGANERYGGKMPSKWDESSQKFTHSMSNEWIMGHDVHQGASTVLSPEFKSAKEYENSPSGARTLTQDHVRPEDRTYYNALYKKVGEKYGALDLPSEYQTTDLSSHDLPQVPSEAHPTVRNLVEAANHSDPKISNEAKLFLNALRTAPSQYGELKLRGNMGITPERVAGVVIHEPTAFELPDYMKNEEFMKQSPYLYAERDSLLTLKDRLVKELRQRKIPFEMVGDNEGVNAMMDLAEKAAPFGGK